MLLLFLGGEWKIVENRKKEKEKEIAADDSAE